VKQEMDEAALKVLKAAEDTKQLLQQKEEVLAEIRGEFEQKSREVGLLYYTCPEDSKWVVQTACLNATDRFAHLWDCLPHCHSQIAQLCCSLCLTCDHQYHRTEPCTKADSPYCSKVSDCSQPQS